MIYSENILVCMVLPLILAAVILRDKTRNFVICFIVGMITSLLGAYVSGFIDVVSGYGNETTAIYISPVVEEIMKFLPLLFLYLLFEPTDEKLVHAATGIGAGFASFENVCSMISSGTENLGFLLIRGLAVGVMHIVSVFVLVIGFAIARKYKVSGFTTILGALSSSMLFHAAYNLLVSEPGVSSAIGFCMPVVTAVILLASYKRLRPEKKATK